MVTYNTTFRFNLAGYVRLMFNLSKWPTYTGKEEHFIFYRNQRTKQTQDRNGMNANNAVYFESANRVSTGSQEFREQEEEYDFIHDKDLSPNRNSRHKNLERNSHVSVINVYAEIDDTPKTPSSNITPVNAKPAARRHRRNYEEVVILPDDYSLAGPCILKTDQVGPPEINTKSTPKQKNDQFDTAELTTAAMNTYIPEHVPQTESNGGTKSEVQYDDTSPETKNNGQSDASCKAKTKDETEPNIEESTGIQACNGKEMLNALTLNNESTDANSDIIEMEENCVYSGHGKGDQHHVVESNEYSSGENENDDHISYQDSVAEETIFEENDVYNKT